MGDLTTRCKAANDERRRVADCDLVDSILTRHRPVLGDDPQRLIDHPYCYSCGWPIQWPCPDMLALAAALGVEP